VAGAGQPGGPDALVRASLAACVRDERVLDAIRAVPRADFVPPEWVDRAYEDAPLPIPHGQVTTQPSLVARMIEGLGLRGGERVLEVGSGYGWQTALLARLAGEVFSIERFPDLAEEARRALLEAGVENATIVVGDGSAGLPERSPFDAVLVAAAFPSVPPPLREQLARGGRLVQPIGPGGADDVTLFVKEERGLRALRTLVPAHFVRLHGEHGFR
jgi:protein-L-isoaspartate(D-aspartate) O-methyltransferase